MKGVFSILIGFKWQKTEDGIFKELKARGYGVDSALRFSKVSIKDYLEKTKRCDAVVLKEYLDGGGRWSAKELAELADITDANIVVVISKAHRGRDFVRELYAAGITSVFFSDGKFGVRPSALTDLAIKKRTRPDAREYMGITDTVIEHDVLPYEDYMDYLRFLTDKNLGINIVDRFVTVSEWVYPQQMGSFIDALPDSAIAILAQYKEFHKIYGKLLRAGFCTRRIKAPKRLKVGIPKEKLEKKYVDDLNRRPEDLKVELEPVRYEREKEYAGNIVDDVEGSPVEERPLPKDSADDDIYDAAERENLRKQRKEEAKRRKAAEAELKKRKKEEKRRKRTDVQEDDEGVGLAMEEQVLQDIPDSSDAVYDSVISEEPSEGGGENVVKEPAGDDMLPEGMTTGQLIDMFGR